MAKTNVYSTLSEEKIAIVDGLIGNVTEQVISTDEETGKVLYDLEAIMATLEKLNELKKIAKEQAEKDAKANKEVEKQEAFARGVELVQGISVGDTIEYTCGSGRNAKTITKTVLKVGDKTITIELTDEEANGSKTNKRYIRFDKITNVIKANAIENAA